VGRGTAQAEVAPAGELTPFRRTERGALREVRVLSAVGHLPRDIAERQAKSALHRLAREDLDPRVETATVEAFGKGSFIALTARFEQGIACCTALGERGKPAGKVGDEAARALLAFLRSDAAVDEYFADQALVPLALIPAPSEYTTCRVTQHLLTNAEVIRRFTDASIAIEGAPGSPGRVRVRGAAPPSAACGQV